MASGRAPGPAVASKPVPGGSKPRVMSKAEAERLAAAFASVLEHHGREDVNDENDDSPGEFVPRETRFRAWAKHHRYPLTAAGYVGGVDLAALTGHWPGVYLTHIGHLTLGSGVHLGLGPWPTLGFLACGAAEGIRQGRRGGYFGHFEREDSKDRAGTGKWRYVKSERSPRTRWYSVGAWAAAMAGMFWGARYGVTTPEAQAVMLGGGFGVLAPWLSRHRRRWRVAGPVEVLPPTVPDPVAPPPELWPERVRFHEAFCRKGGELAGAVMEEPVRIEHGWQAEIQLVQGDQSTDNVRSLFKRIASLYGVPLDQVVTEHVGSRQEDRARLTIITEAEQFHTAEHWTRGTYDINSGCCWVGRFMDGERVLYRFNTPGSGGWHSIVTGSTGAGKSALMSLLLAEAVHACDLDGERVMVPWILDPQGQSLPLWSGWADLTALGPGTCVMALRTLYKALVARSIHLGRQPRRLRDGREVFGQATFNPTADLPLWVVVLDEAHILLQHPVFGKEVAWLLGQCVKLGRKVGLSFILGSQLAHLTELKDEAIRSMLAGMGATCLRSGERRSAGMLGIEGQPFYLPVDKAGLGYTKGPNARSGAQAQFAWIGPEEAELDAIESGGRKPLDDITIGALAKHAAKPTAVTGTPKGTLIPWEYEGDGQILQDAA